MSYAAHKKDINRNKSFHPLTFSNLSKVEARLETEQEKAKLQQSRRVQLQREADERRYDDLLSGGIAEGGEKPFKRSRVEWMGFTKDDNSDDGAGSAPSGAPETNTSAPPVAAQPQNSTNKKVENSSGTGTVSSSEAQQMRKQADDERKRRLDPLAKVLAMEDEYVSQIAKAQQQQRQLTLAVSCDDKAGGPTVSSRQPEVPIADNQRKIQSAIQQLLAKKKAM
jgi:hypothetical protein